MTHAKPTKQNKKCSCGHHHRETAYPLCCQAWLTVGTCPACGSTHVAFEGKPAHLLPFVLDLGEFCTNEALEMGQALGMLDVFALDMPEVINALVKSEMRSPSVH